MKKKSAWLKQWPRVLAGLITLIIILAVFPSVLNNSNSSLSSANTQNQATHTLLENKKFFEENKRKPNVIALSDGLQYKIIKEGHGNSPNATDYVKIHYRGTFIDGREFDRSERPGAPSTFAIDAVVPGLSEALQRMKPGAEWIIYIPPDLGYGEQGVNDKIPPNAALIFHIELLSVSPAPNESVTDVLEELKERD